MPASPMSDADLHRWQSASNMWQLGQVMAAWIKDQVHTRPGPQLRLAAPGVHTMAGTSMRAALAEMNSIGLVTIDAQPGGSGVLAGGVWDLVPAVWGLATGPALAGLIPALPAAGYHLRVHPVRPWWNPLPGRGVPVAGCDGKPVVFYGRRLTAAQLRREFDVCTPRMHAVLAGCEQFTIWKHEPGANDLWPLLAEWSSYQR